MKARIINGVIDIIDYSSMVSKINTEYEYDITVNCVSDSIIDAILKKKDEERTVEDLKKIVTRKNIEDRKAEKLKCYEDYKDLIIEEYSGSIGEYEVLNPVFEDTGDAIKQTYKAVFSRQKVEEEIDKLKKQLIDTDYQVIKYYEAKITLSETPYSADEINGIIAQRQSIRDKINELQDMINK